jgi:major membrane immunogen (membrane-anchored lipoprotein)
MTDPTFNPRMTFCDNPDCDEQFEQSADDVFRVQTPDDISALSGDTYCSARCAARGMAQYDGVDRVNVYEEDRGVTPGGVTDDD